MMMHQLKINFLCLIALSMASLSIHAQTNASNSSTHYPDKPVRVILGFPSGAVTDTLTRTVAQQLGQKLNQQFVVENKPGAATRIAMETMQKSPADGYTIAVGNAVVSTFGLMFDGMSFDPGKEFVPISMLGRSPSFLAVRGNMPVKNYEEFKTFAKGAKLSVGHPGNGTNPHIAGAALARSLGVDAVEIAFKGGTPLATALASGDIDFAMVDYQSTRGLVDKGAIKLLAVTEPKRFSQRPDIPTGKELGILPEIEGLTPWFILMAPAGTPKPVIDRLNHEVRAIMSSPEMTQKMGPLGLEPDSSTPEQAGAYFLSHRKKIEGLLSQLNISIKN